MTLHETIPLPNGFTLTLWDHSQEIAAKTVRVELVAQMEVPFLAAYFTNQEDHDRLVKTIGPVGLYEYRKVRALVNAAKKDAVFEDLVTTFKGDALPYLSKADFPQQFTRSKFRDIVQNWYKYAAPHEET